MSREFYVSDLVAILKEVDVIRVLKPDTGNPVFIKEVIAKMTDDQVEQLFHAIDDLCLSVRDFGTMVAFTDLRSTPGMPSPLVVDSALVRVDFAALQVRRGQTLNEEAVPAAKLLKEFFVRQLNLAKSSGPIIPPRLVQDQETREVLQKGLASICRTKPAFDHHRAASIERLIKLLSILVDTGTCGSGEAEELHSLILYLEPKRAHC